MHPVARSLFRPLAILVGVSILFVAGCQGARTPSLEEIFRSLQEFSFQRQEELILNYPCDDPDQLPPEVAALLAEANAIQNEVHDCQKLVMNGQTQREFGPLVGIFPIQSAEPVLTDDRGIVVATIFNWGTEDYGPLDIGEHWSCLVLKPGGASAWSAEIRPAAARCAVANFADYDPVSLSVVRTEHHDVPMTARWGWDEEDDVHYIGFSCPVGPSAWCEVGPPGFQPRAWLQIAGQRTVPGWYDEQYLAVPDPSSSRLRPGPWGTIFPDASLRNATAGTYAGSRGAVAAYVLLQNSTNSAAYTQRFGFEATPGVTVPMDGNRIRLRSGSDNSWTALVHPPGASQAARRFPVTFVDLPHGASGSVRWRWSGDDESWWVPCPDGCCSPAENGGAS